MAIINRSQHFMKRIIIIFAIALLPWAGAEELVVGDPAWGARIRLPEKWESDNYTGMWYQGWTHDRKVWLSAITFAKLPDQWHKKWLTKHCDTFGVTIKVPATKPNGVDCRLGVFDAKEYRIVGVWEDENAEISVYEIVLAPDRVFLFTLGGKPDDRQQHKETLAAIVGSIRIQPAKEQDKGNR